MDKMLGFGVAGNFANHLEQAGEACDFAQIEGEEENAPKGLFPFYIPHNEGFLGRFCYDNHKIILPKNQSFNIQAEPEVGLECEITYQDNHIKSIQPKFFMAFNDVSIRNDKNAKKLSQKKNFSSGSKAIGQKIALDVFDVGGICDRYSIASFVESQGVMESYGEKSELVTYSYFYTKLLDWIARKLNTQEDCGVLENLWHFIQEARYPSKAIFAVGATRYTPKNEHRFLKNGNKVAIIVYNHTKYTFDDIQEIAKHRKNGLADMSVIYQDVVQG
ncbi:DUF5718 family protein [uncultured Helicobacter sp.]|uniref:DUF5718 family protein n=1 Tax=uncultured Helicobacter sp. TaxID=175537 RepID=UPI00258EA92D|nr:DUF5718 family protein [uncultured Helicobacter sp.]